MTPSLPVIAVTSGEPAGIGPEICAQLLRQQSFASRCHLVLIGDRDLIRAQSESGASDWPDYQQSQEPLPPISILHEPLIGPNAPGTLNPDNARYVTRLLDHAVAGCLEKRFAAMLTAPVHKGVINDAGIPFSGHTEYLAAATDTQRVVMMLACGTFRVALATTHLPLRQVSDALSQTLLEEVIRIMNHDLIHRFRINAPAIQLCGLNPHAGEGGHLGDEEIRFIQPAAAACRARGIRVSDPVPADTAFGQQRIQSFDATLAMYHDQGLPVLKHASFGQAVNITLGLPITRVSVDHGTAMDIAGQGKASSDSLLAALNTAIDLASH